MRLLTKTGLVLASASLASAQQIHYSVDTLPVLGNSFGNAGAGVGDLASEGHDDYVVGAPYTSTQGTSDFVGAVHAYSGIDGSLLFEVLGPDPLGNFGTSVDAAGDVNGDGIPDIVVGAPAADPFLPYRLGRAFVLSGADGSTLRAYQGTFPGGLFGWSVAGLDDGDGDSVPDQVIGAPFDRTVAGGAIHGRTMVFSGATGAVLHNIEGLATGDSYGKVVANTGDWNGDGRGDFAVWSQEVGSPFTYQGHVEVVSGADASVLFSYTDSTGTSQIAETLGAGADVNGDGVFDLAVAHRNGGVGVLPYVTVFSGADQSVLLTIEGTDNLYWGRGVALVGDSNGDDLSEIAVISDTGAGTLSFASIYSGKDGSLFVGANPPPNTAGGTGGFVARVGDTNGDNLTDWLVGDVYRQDPNLAQYGSVYVISRTGLGNQICEGDLNSTGVAATLTVTGSTVVATNSFELTVDDLPFNSMGMMLSSRAIDTYTVPFGLFPDLCIAGSRVGRGSLFVTPLGGTVVVPIDLQAVPLPDGQNYLHPVQAGETIMWQYWHKFSDLAGSDFVFSQAIAVPFD